MINLEKIINIVLNIICRTKEARGEEGFFIVEEKHKPDIILNKKSKDKYYIDLSMKNLNENILYKEIIINNKDIYCIEKPLRKNDILVIRILNEHKFVINNLKILYNWKNNIFTQYLINNSILSKPKKLNKIEYKRIIKIIYKNFFRS